MQDKISVQIQAVIYHNDKSSLLKSVEHLANAVRQERKLTGRLDRVIMKYGDASDSPVLSEEDVAQMQRLCADWIAFEYVPFGFNSGFGRGQNLLSEDCACDLMLVMNPDVIVTPRFFVEMLDPFENERVGLVEARQTPIEHHKEYNKETFETEWAAMACVMVRTNIWKELDGIDSDTFFMYCEDVDFSWRLRLLGYTIFYQAKAPVYHAKRIGADGSWQPTRAERYYSAESALLMAHKWSNRKREKQILKAFLNGDEMYRKIAQSFIQRKEEGRLPKPLDPHHKVARFMNGDYGPSRFML